MVVQITVLRGPNAGQTYEFSEDIIQIGSGRNNHLILRDNDVSTDHCRLVRIETDYDIEDLQSRFGTYVNGQPLVQGDKWLLKSGSIIELGSQVTLEYRQNEGDSVARPFFMNEGDPGSQPCLVLVDKATIKEAYLLQSKDITIGRSIGNDIVIQNTDISRTHFRLIWKNGRYYIQDLKSRNGTFVNGEPVDDVIQLNHSDVIRMGSSTQLHFVHRSDLPEEWDPIQPGRKRDDKRETDDVTLPFASQRRDGTRELPKIGEETDLDNHILIAYARDDWEDIVATLVLNLNDAKQNVWVDQHLRPGSETWRQELNQAQTECWLLLVIVSPAVMEAPHTRDLYRYFVNREKPVLLINYKPVERLPIQLVNVPMIEFDPESPGKMFRQLLLEVIQLKPRYLGRGES